MQQRGGDRARTGVTTPVLLMDEPFAVGGTPARFDLEI